MPAVVIMPVITTVLSNEDNFSDFEGTIQIHLPGPPAGARRVVNTDSIEGFTVISVKAF